MKDNFTDKLFRDKLCDHDIKPPINLWDCIDKELNDKKTKIINWKWISGLAATVLVLLSGITIYDNLTSTDLENIVNDVQAENGVITLPANKIKELMNNVESYSGKNVIVSEGEKKINTNFLRNSPKKGQEVQYYVEKEIDSVNKTLSEKFPFISNGTNNSRTVSN